MMPVSAPPRVRDWIASAPDRAVRIVHRGAHAAYLEIGGGVGARCVGVVGTAAAALPCALRVATADLGGLTAGAAHVENGVLHLDGVPLRIGRLVDVRVRAMLAGAGCSRVPGAAGDLVVRIGRGPGLTPEADDVLVGWLAAHRAAGLDTPDVDAGVTAALTRTTLLSATLLECALLGEVVPELAGWLAALGTPAEDERAAALVGIGHTSGAAMHRGGRLALAHLYGRAERVA